MYLYVYLYVHTNVHMHGKVINLMYGMYGIICVYSAFVHVNYIL